jgi:FlaA1/EpsC-like NDP-sugar epimerase
VYRSWRGSRLYLECITILKAWIIMAGLLFFLLFITKTSTIFSRKVLLIWTMTTPLVIMLLHICARFILRYLRRRGYNTKNAVIVGAGQHGYDFARFITDNPWTGIRIAGYFDDRLKPRPGDSPDEKIKILGTFRDVREFLQNNIVDYIYLALPLRAQKRIEYVLSLTRTGGAQVFLVPDLFSYYMQNA